jgi:predicted nucleic acid-binding protein
MPAEYLAPAIEVRAVKISHCWPITGSSAPSVSGLIIAATAELAGLTVLRRDKDFDLIANVSGQAVW